MKKFTQNFTNNFVCITFVLVFIDQAVKIIVQKYYSHLIILNKGVFFGWVDNIFITALSIITGLLLLIFLIRYIQIKDWVELTAVSMLIAGAASNVLDRILRGSVMDYIQMPYLSWWPKFNIADCFIFLGIIVYLYHLLELRQYKK